MKKPTKIWLGVLITIIVIIGISITPTIWRYSSYRKARLAIESADEAKAIQIITKLHKNPFFDLDWTVQSSVKKIPHGFLCYEKLFGCPSCRGDFYTLLYHSAYNGHEELTRIMIKFGAPLERWDDSGERVLRAAVISRNPDVIELVIDSGADVNAMEDSLVSFSAIHVAVMIRSQEDAISLLLQKGANINLENNKGQTPLDYAHTYNTNIIPFLTRNGAIAGSKNKMHNQRVDLTVKTPVD